MVQSVRPAGRGSRARSAIVPALLRHPARRRDAGSFVNLAFPADGRKAWPEATIQGDEDAYYADKAYDSKALREKLASLGIDDKIAYKAKRNKPLKNWQKWFNTTASSARSGVERANATMKNWYGMARVHYRGLARNNCHLQFVACAMNMKRARILLRAT